MKALAIPLLLLALLACPDREELSRERLLPILAEAGVTDPARRLTHLSHTCDLEVDGATLGVYDVREIVPGMPSPRGVNQIVLLRAGKAAGEASDETPVVQALRYISERPLCCDGDRLLVFGDLHVETPEGTQSGNALRFLDGGARIEVGQVEVGGKNAVCPSLSPATASPAPAQKP